ncbi:hypothetical protein BKK79_32200 [Cupriavidus sp. USMAA2-4]|uniref:DUF883 family protein n=1 Tax=Cupriavidus sp. USMAA2-4 TaxID=876364 RepID=UPI0008A6A5E7|nr:DUF883 family protein [Cupriavidus sp. USMAA2-4]AOY96271.1 hypothetical protein BKK79_32200 [Cupriavidus sp. USMAA2-4]
MNDIRTDYSMHRDVLTRDVNALLTDVQALLRDVANEAGTEAAQAGTEVGMRLRELQGRLGMLRQTGMERVSQWANSTDQYAREHPWQCIGTAATVAAAVSAIVTLSLYRR